MMLANVVLLLAGVAVSAARDSPSGGATCTTKAQRRAWHTLTDVEKASYIEAELCLIEKEATLDFNGTKNRFEELQAAHQIQADIIHGVGAFLPFHRLLMHAHEKLLQEECGYDGTQPYWDETKDSGSFNTSDVLDPVTGFGGNGVGDEGCIADGPFASYINSLGPGYMVTDHCITRFVSNRPSVGAAQESLDTCYEAETFVGAWPCIEAMPHIAGHAGVGGLMLDPIASPGDPIFYLHHSWLDKVWWGWQALDLPARLTDIGGQNVQDAVEGFPEIPGDDGGNSTGPPGGFPGGGGFPPPEAMVPPKGAAPQIPEGDPGDETTLQHVLNMFGVIPDATIEEVMDIGGDLLCYEYV